MEELNDKHQAGGAGDLHEQRVIVYSKDFCPYCVRAKALLDRKGVAYELRDLTGDIDGMRAIAEFSGRMTLPQIVIDGKPIGGFQELQQVVRDPAYQDLFKAA